MQRTEKHVNDYHGDATSKAHPWEPLQNKGLRFLNKYSSREKKKLRGEPIDLKEV